MPDRFEREIKETARKIISNLALTKIDIRNHKKRARDRGIESKKRVEELLGEARAKREIVDFLPTLSLVGANGYRDGRRPHPDFWIVLIKGSKRIIASLKVKSSQRGADEYWEKTKRKGLGGNFMETQILIAGPRISNRQLKRDWQKILRHFRES